MFLVLSSPLQRILVLDSMKGFVSTKLKYEWWVFFLSVYIIIFSIELNLVIKRLKHENRNSFELYWVGQIKILRDDFKSQRTYFFDLAWEIEIVLWSVNYYLKIWHSVPLTLKHKKKVFKTAGKFVVSWKKRFFASDTIRLPSYTLRLPQY